ncbi:hypothetical protein OUZ56_013621 [Daphnia magna]|uniref:Uncharacterized protein n=1 Tax=Daphnia magna TaxID=35525 RepID=A0ABQ9Z6E8_9CRUS|nr:hypothetical protein OUZ56_013621 [Daphnia magna]
MDIISARTAAAEMQEYQFIVWGRCRFLNVLDINSEEKVILTPLPLLDPFDEEIQDRQHNEDNIKTTKTTSIEEIDGVMLKDASCPATKKNSQIPIPDKENRHKQNQRINNQTNSTEEINGVIFKGPSCLATKKIVDFEIPKQEIPTSEEKTCQKQMPSSALFRDDPTLNVLKETEPENKDKKSEKSSKEISKPVKNEPNDESKAVLLAICIYFVLTNSFSRARMLSDRIIQPSNSSWSSPVVLVKKKMVKCGSV